MKCSELLVAPYTFECKVAEHTSEHSGLGVRKGEVRVREGAEGWREGEVRVKEGEEGGRRRVEGGEGE